MQEGCLIWRSRFTSNSSMFEILQEDGYWLLALYLCSCQVGPCYNSRMQ